jgi:hypothetical protein
MGFQHRGKCPTCGKTIQWHGDRNPHRCPKAKPMQTESMDVDSGLGIGGLATYEEPPMVPSVAAIEKHARRLETAQRCRRCGQTELDGAMFTTLGGSGICDDCV